MKLTIRYDELKVRYLSNDVAILRTQAGEDIYIPTAIIEKLKADEWLPLNTGEKRKLSWKDYLVDEINGKHGWVWYYPTTYKSNGFYYKIRADLYYEGETMCPEISVANDMADAFYDNMKKKSEFKDKVYYNKAPDSRLVRKALPSKVSGDMFNIIPIAIWLKTGDYVETMSLDKWQEEYSDWTRHMAVVLECLIENKTCFIAMKHIKIDTTK